MSVKVTVALSEALLAQVDAVARAEGRSRGALIRAALRRYVATRQPAGRPGDRPQVRAAVASMHALAQVASGRGEDSTADVRRWRDARR